MTKWATGRESRRYSANQKIVELEMLLRSRRFHISLRRVQRKTTKIMLKNPAPPDHIQQVFRKRGESWIIDERHAVVEWLDEPKQKGQVLRFAALHLGPGARAEDAEDAWQEFHAKQVSGGTEWDYTVNTFDPARGTFQDWLLLRLKQFCWRRRPPVVPRPRLDQDGEIVEIEISDPDAATEEDYVRLLLASHLKECVQKLDPIYRDVVDLRYFHEMSFAEIAGTLDIAEGDARVRHHRALRMLRPCLDPQVP